MVTRQFRTKFLALCVLASALWAVPAGAAAAQEEAAPPTRAGAAVVPFRSLPGHGMPLFRVRFDNGAEGEFSFDSNLGGTALVRKEIARRFGTPRPARGKLPPAAGSRSSRTVRGEAVLTGWAEMEAFRRSSVILLLDPLKSLERLSELAGIPPLDGIIGPGLVEGGAIAFEFDRHQALLWKQGNLSPEQLQAAGFEGATVVPLRRWMGASYLVKAKVNDQRDVEFVISTGAIETTLPAEIASELGLRAVEERNVFTFNGDLDIKLASGNTLGLGSILIDDVTLKYPAEATQSGAASHYIPRIGMEVLSRFRVLIDDAALKMYLQPIPKPPGEAGAP